MKHRILKTCVQYGNIFDKVAGKNISVCGLISNREEIVYTSMSNELVVTVLFKNVETVETGISTTFLIQVTGNLCLD